MNKFERNEKKYIVPKKDYEELMKDLSLFVQKDKYHQYTIYNLYLDNDRFDLISRSLEKPVYKEKVRIRKYNQDGEAYIELKKKYKRVVYKRRVPLTETGTQIRDEIDYTIRHYDLKPKVFLAYDRLAYVAKDNPDLRITFDHHLRYRFNDLKLEDTIDNHYYFQDEFYLMEIKIPGGMPLWLSHLLTEYHIYPASFSKYGKIYEKEKEHLNYV